MGGMLGKHSLSLLSPKKTWEGFIGAFFSTLIWCYFFTKFLSVLKVIGIILGVIVLAIAAFFVVLQIKTHKALNDLRLADNYYESIPTGGELEKKYLGNGGFAVEHTAVNSDNKSIKNIYIYYPAELKTSGNQYPLIMVVNGSQTPAKTYLPFFERLASWGFIVVGNDDPQPGTGETASITLDYVLNESEIKGSIDRSRMGVAGYSQGGAGAINAATKFENSKLYSTLFTGSAAYPMLAIAMGWAYDPADISVSYFMTASTGTSDDMGKPDSNTEYNGVSPLQALKEIYNTLPDSLDKVRGRCVNAEHGDMQERTDGYMTAWMLWQLQGDEAAAKVFVGDNAEILTNALWQDIEKNR